jgi:hypothetical protein
MAAMCSPRLDEEEPHPRFWARDMASLERLAESLVGVVFPVAELDLSGPDQATFRLNLAAPATNQRILHRSLICALAHSGYPQQSSVLFASFHSGPVNITVFWFYFINEQFFDS